MEFESSCYSTPEFMAFAAMYKKRINKEIELFGMKVVKWSNGHFYCSAFIENIKTGKLAYLSISDVRHFSGSWYGNILVRTAKSLKDYCGGSNHSSKLSEVGSALAKLTEAT